MLLKEVITFACAIFSCTTGKQGFLCKYPSRILEKNIFITLNPKYYETIGTKHLTARLTFNMIIIKFDDHNNC